MSEEIQGFVAPAHPPQMSSDGTETLRELMVGAPGWNPNYATELAHLCRNHIVIRSALGFVLELAQQANQQLIVENEPNEIFRKQGAIRALQQSWATLMHDMENPPKAKETQQ